MTARLVWTRPGYGKWRLSSHHNPAGDTAKMRAAIGDRAVQYPKARNVYHILFDDEVTQAAYDAVYPTNIAPEWAREWEVQ